MQLLFLELFVILLMFFQIFFQYSRACARILHFSHFLIEIIIFWFAIQTKGKFVDISRQCLNGKPLVLCSINHFQTLFTGNFAVRLHVLVRINFNFFKCPTISKMRSHNDNLENFPEKKTSEAANEATSVKWFLPKLLLEFFLMQLGHLLPVLERKSKTRW